MANTTLRSICVVKKLVIILTFSFDWSSSLAHTAAWEICIFK
jgi:hypothetical protein